MGLIEETYLFCDGCGEKEDSYDGYSDLGWELARSLDGVYMDRMYYFCNACMPYAALLCNVSIEQVKSGDISSEEYMGAVDNAVSSRWGYLCSAPVKCSDETVDYMCQCFEEVEEWEADPSVSINIDLLSVATIKRLTTLLATYDDSSVLSLSASKVNDEVLQVLHETKNIDPLICETDVTDSQAACLAKYNGTLELKGLTSLSDAAAESLSKHEGGLNLRGLTSLSDAAAESLSKHEGGLNLRGLTELSDTAAQSLTKKEPKFRSWEIKLDNLPASAAQILRDAGHGE
jgi:hypothetical protein